MNDPLKKLRRAFRIWRNQIRLERETRYYESRFTALNLRIPDDDAIKSSIQNKYPHIKAKNKGDLAILAVYHNYNWEEESLRPALEKFGKLYTYDWMNPAGNQDYHKNKNLISQINKSLLERVGDLSKRERIDVIFCYLSGEQLLTDSALALRSFKIPLINLALNDKEHFVGKFRFGQARGSRDICRFFDICWTSTEEALKKYVVEGALPLYLPEGANPDKHKPYNVEKTIDVSFIGQCYGKRPEIIKKIKEAGIRVEAYGVGWPNGPLSTDEMVKMYSKSRVNLGFGSVDGYKNAYCLKGRDFEVPMSGGFYLTEYHPELNKFFKINEEIAAYSGPDDLISKIRFFLSNPDKAEKIRIQGLSRALREHTWEMRFDKVFHLAGLI